MTIKTEVDLKAQKPSLSQRNHHTILGEGEKCLVVRGEVLVVLITWYNVHNNTIISN